MLNDGIIIMVVGMLVVFLFLTIMVLTMKTMSGIILKHFPEPEESVPVRGNNGNISGKDEAELAAVIAAAWMQR